MENPITKYKRFLEVQGYVFENETPTIEEIIVQTKKRYAEVIAQKSDGFNVEISAYETAKDYYSYQASWNNYDGIQTALGANVILPLAIMAYYVSLFDYTTIYPKDKLTEDELIELLPIKTKQLYLNDEKDVAEFTEFFNARGKQMLPYTYNKDVSWRGDNIPYCGYNHITDFIGWYGDLNHFLNK